MPDTPNTTATRTRTVLVTTFAGAVVLATATSSTVVEYDELDALIRDLTAAQDQLGDAR